MAFKQCCLLGRAYAIILGFRYEISLKESQRDAVKGRGPSVSLMVLCR